MFNIFFVQEIRATNSSKTLHKNRASHPLFWALINLILILKYLRQHLNDFNSKHNHNR